MQLINTINEELSSLCDIAMFGECARNKLLGLHTTKYEYLIKNITKQKLISLLSKHGRINKGQQKNIIVLHSDNVDLDFHILEERDNFPETLRKLLNNKYFTINAIAYDLTNYRWTDTFGGIDDMRIKAIKLIDPSSIKTNPFLLLTTARLAAQLKFTIPIETWFRLYDYSSLIKNVSPKIINNELSQLLLTDKPSVGLKYLQETGILNHILPEVSDSEVIIQTRRSNATNVFSHTMHAVDACEKDLTLRLAILFHDCGKRQTMTCDTKGNIHFFGHEKVGANIAKLRLTKLLYPASMINDIEHLISHHMFDASPQLKPSAVRRLIKKVRKEHIDNLIKLREADRKGTSEPISMRKIELLKKKIKMEIQNV
jgi:tRNA nucleotidyltransferase (CCA-adding enzyme)